jgi:hypothetical protein
MCAFKTVITPTTSVLIAFAVVGGGKAVKITLLSLYSAIFLSPSVDFDVFVVVLEHCIDFRFGGQPVGQ